MRKLSKSRSMADLGYAIGLGRDDERPRCVAGGTITSWPGVIDIDLSAILARPASGGTIGGAALVSSERRQSKPSRTVSLSDGTRITFATAVQADVAEYV